MNIFHIVSFGLFQRKTGMRRRIGPALVKTAIIILFMVVLFAFIIEGLAGFIIVGLDIRNRHPMPERMHTQYDKDLGWTNIPDVHVNHMYGQGIYLKTNSQGFRGSRSYGKEVPAGKTRVICAGDSFTLGVGVDNDHTFCSILEGMDERLETVNMGQGGYGFDQAYLWYKRDGMKLDHDIAVLAFVTRDFQRMEGDLYVAHGKPVLWTADGRIFIRNVPVPKYPFFTMRLNRYLPAVNHLHAIRLAKHLYPRHRADHSISKEQAGEAVAAVIDDLHRISAEKDIITVLLYLPCKKDYGPRDIYEDWRGLLEAETAGKRVILIDLMQEFRTLSGPEMRTLFIRPGDMDCFGVDWHYNNKGNAYIADLIYKKLLSVPEISEKINR